MNHRTLAVTVLLGLIMGCGSVGPTVPHDEPPMTQTPAASVPLPAVPPPVAERRPHALTHHGDVRDDPYYWLRSDDRSDPAVLAHLEAENTYTLAALKPVEATTKVLFEELKGRLKKDDASVPVKRPDGHWYYARFEGDAEHAIHCRRAGTLDADEQVILDVNVLAKPHDYYAIGSMSVSDDSHLLAFTEDTVSRRQYTVRFKDLRTGELLADEVPNTTGSVAWAADGRTVFYVKRDETLRSRWVYRHVLGTPHADDALVWDEQDTAYYVRIGRSKSREYVAIVIDSTLTSEVRVVPAAAPATPPVAVLPREDGHEYSVAHYGDHFYVLTNWNAQNFRLMKAPVATSADKATWTEVIAHRDDVLLMGVEPFATTLVVSERKDALRSLRVIPHDGSGEHDVAFDEALYVARVGSNPSFDTPTLRFHYSSPLTPASVFDYDMHTRERTLMKRDTVLGGYDPARFDMARSWATARDGARVPISLVFPKGTPRDGSAPLYLYGYGAYGHALDPSFNASRLSLLDRGFVVATAHVRGGQELGRAWYDTGRVEHKQNTFDDFIDATEHLIAEGWGAKGRVVASGGSAGGLLVGAVVNQRPDLYGVVHAVVPFVDVLTTMLDASIPLTTNEYDEWGNPEDKRFYDVIRAYSPYDNIQARAYPHMIVTTGLHDSQVQYWEPAKWVAKLRHHKTDSNLLVLDTDMSTGHGGASGRFARYEKTAQAYAFILFALGMAP